MKGFILSIVLFITGLPVMYTQGLISSAGAQRSQHPLISEILAEVNQDSLTAQIQSLVDFGTRFMYCENRKQVAEFIADKFRGYGYTDVVLDSFKVEGETVPEDSVWQYNVVASFTGSSAPGEIYILSAHHDSYANPDPHILAPGADDNGSGVASVLEIARVLKAKGFQPGTTIRFITFAAEELTYYPGNSGSVDYANRLAAKKEDLRLVINNDMIAYTPNSSWPILGADVPGPFPWAGDLMALSAGTYTPLQVIHGNYPTSDAFHFNELGYPNTGFQELNLTPQYHTIHDSIQYCMMDFCREVVKATCAILLNEQLTPVPQSPSVITGINSVTIAWKETANQNVQGFRIYRSTKPDTSFTMIAEENRPVSSFRDTTITPGILYYYYLTSFDQQSYESIPSAIVRGAASLRNRELLVVKDSKGGFNNPVDSAVISCYQEIFSGLDHDLSDASVTDTLDLAILGKYQKIFWLSNTFSYQPNSSFRRNIGDITTWLESGGQLFVANFNPTFIFTGNTKPNMTFSPTDTVREYFKIGKVERQSLAMLNGAMPAAADYDTLRVDSAKCMTQYPGHLMNVECITPSPDANLIYLFSSAYDTSTVHGSMKGKPVGIEYLGEDYKVIILSVPLYYLDSTDAKELVDLVAKEKFRKPTGIETGPGNTKAVSGITCIPNPCKEETKVRYTLKNEGYVRIRLISMSGEILYDKNEGVKRRGTHEVILATGTYVPGIYLIVLETKAGVLTGKLVVN